MERFGLPSSEPVDQVFLQMLRRQAMRIDELEQRVNALEMSDPSVIKTIYDDLVRFDIENTDLQLSSQTAERSDSLDTAVTAFSPPPQLTAYQEPPPDSPPTNVNSRVYNRQQIEEIGKWWSDTVGAPHKLSNVEVVERTEVMSITVQNTFNKHGTEASDQRRSSQGTASWIEQNKSFRQALQAYESPNQQHLPHSKSQEFGNHRGGNSQPRNKSQQKKSPQSKAQRKKGTSPLSSHRTVTMAKRPPTESTVQRDSAQSSPRKIITRFGMLLQTPDNEDDEAGSS